MPRPCGIAIDTSGSGRAYTRSMKTTIELPGVEERLKKRYNTLVEEHTGHAHPVAAGPRHLPGSDAHAAAQAAWRFFKNPRTRTTVLALPLLQEARAASASACDRYCLVVGDWSPLDYTSHNDKPDRIPLANKGELGYELFSQL